MHATETKARKERGGNAPVNMERDREIIRTTRNKEEKHMRTHDRERERERERKRENVIMCDRKCVARGRGKQDRNSTTKDCQKVDQRMLIFCKAVLCLRENKVCLRESDGVNEHTRD